MVAVTPSEVVLDPGVDVTRAVEPARHWLLPTPAPVDRGMFDRALRAASVMWQPHRTELPEPAAESGVSMALPAVLEAWRATLRELAGMAGDNPAQELLEANALILRAMYQRLYRERMRK